MGLTLYELAGSFRDIANILEEMPDESLQVALDQIGGEFSVKAENICKMAIALEKEAEVIDKEIKRLQSRKASRTSRAKWLRGYVKRGLEATGEKPIKAPMMTIYLQDSQSVEIFDKEAIPAKFVTVKIDKQYDKKQIGEQLKAGEEVPGARLVQGKHLQIR